MLIKPKEFETGGFALSQVRTDNLLQMKLFENDDLTIVVIFSCKSFTQTQIKKRIIVPCRM